MICKKEQNFSFSKTKLTFDFILSLFCCLLYSTLLLESNYVNTNKFVYKTTEITRQEIPKERNDSIGYSLTNETVEREPIYSWHESDFKIEKTLTATQNHFNTFHLLQTVIVLAIFVRAIFSLTQNIYEGMRFENLFLDPGVLIDLLSLGFILISIFASSSATLYVPLFLQSFNARNAFILLLLKYRESSTDFLYKNSSFCEWALKLNRIAIFCDTICVLYCIATLQFYLETICMDRNAESIHQLFYDWAHAIARSGLFYVFNPFAYFGRLSLLSTSILILALPEIKYKSKILS